MMVGMAIEVCVHAGKRTGEIRLDEQEIWHSFLGAPQYYHGVVFCDRRTGRARSSAWRFRAYISGIVSQNVYYFREKLTGDGSNRAEWINPMAFPEPSDKIVYDNNPLAEVKAGLLLSPVLELKCDQGAKFQALIREEYPYCLDKANRPYEFVAENATWKAALGADIVGLATTTYDRWFEFRERLEEVTEAFVEAYCAPELIGVELLYRDVIDPAELELEDGNWSWKDLISEPLRGPLESKHVGGQVRQAFGRTEFALERCPGRLRLLYGLDRLDNGRQVYVIESLFHHELEGDLDDGYRQLDSFRSLASIVFRWAITERLHEKLSPRRVEE